MCILVQRCILVVYDAGKAWCAHTVLHGSILHEVSQSWLAGPLRCSEEGKLQWSGSHLLAFCDKKDVRLSAQHLPRKCRTILAADVDELQTSVSFLHGCATVAGWWFTACGAWLIAQKGWLYLRRKRVGSWRIAFDACVSNVHGACNVLVKYRSFRSHVRTASPMDIRSCCSMHKHAQDVGADAALQALRASCAPVFRSR